MNPGAPGAMFVAFVILLALKSVNSPADANDADVTTVNAIAKLNSLFISPAPDCPVADSFHKGSNLVGIPCHW